MDAGTDRDKGAAGLRAHTLNVDDLELAKIKKKEVDK